MKNKINTADTCITVESIKRSLKKHKNKVKKKIYLLLINCVKLSKN